MDSISNRGINAGLGNISKAVAQLGNPEKKHKTIHIAGTNGKGSSCISLAEILINSGYKVGVMLSPHVNDYRERIQISDPTTNKLQLIPIEDLIVTHEKIKSKITIPLTYYEWGILIGFVYFAENDLDFVILETGLGGRWDATNICDSLVSGITTIGYDHTHILGDTLEKILTEKIQIVKQESHFVFGAKDAKLIEHAQSFCKIQNAEFYPVKEIQKTENYLEENYNFALNIALVLQNLGFVIDAPNKKSIDMPARLETIQESPKIMIDGAHNEQGIEKLKQSIGSLKDAIMVFGCLKDRDFLGLAHLLKASQNIWVQFDAGSRTMPEKEYRRVQEAVGGKVVKLDTDFVQSLIYMKTDKTIILCGSFYLCSQFREIYNLIPRRG